MTDDQYRELAERAHRLRELTRDPAWQTLETHVRGRADKRNRRLLSGKAKTLEAYGYEAGWISGALWVLGLTDELDNQLRAESQAREEAQAAPAGV